MSGFRFQETLAGAQWQDVAVSDTQESTRTSVPDRGASVPEGGSGVPEGLKLAAGYGWRILVLIAVAAVVLSLVAQLQLVMVAMFVGLIVSALLSPLVKVFDRFLPRALAVALSLIILVVGFAAVVTFIATQVAGEWSILVDQFSKGLAQIQTWIQGPPLNIDDAQLTQWWNDFITWLNENRGTIAAGAVGQLGAVTEILVAAALALFASIFFLHGGREIWQWGISPFRGTTRARIDGAGQMAWRSFAGYTRGIIIVAGSNAVIVAILLLILGVPLALPLALLVFFGTFIPLIGAPVAMFAAVIVALAARGPVIALVVLVGIFLVGQFEGHVLQPLVMSKAVHIHPLAVAVAVAAGTILVGLFGAVIAVPVVSIVYVVIKFWVKTNPRRGPDDPGIDPEIEQRIEAEEAEIASLDYGHYRGGTAAG